MKHSKDIVIITENEVQKLDYYLGAYKVVFFIGGDTDITFEGTMNDYLSYGYHLVDVFKDIRGLTCFKMEKDRG